MLHLCAFPSHTLIPAHGLARLLEPAGLGLVAALCWKLAPFSRSEGHGSGSLGPGSEVDLPPDIDSEDGDEEKVAMPCEMKAHCNCCRNCLKKFDGDTIDSWPG